MKPKLSRRALLGLVWALAISAPLALGKVDDSHAHPKAYLDGTGPGWKELVEDDFTDVNCDPETWTWKDGVIHCTGQPVGVIRTKKPVTNFELVAEWRHLRSGGNSGIFVWAPEKALEGIKPDSLPQGRHRGADPRPRIQGAIRETVRQEGDLVHDRRRRLPGRVRRR